MRVEFAQRLIELMRKSLRIVEQERALMGEAMDAKDWERAMMHRARLTVHGNRIIRYQKKLKEHEAGHDQ